MKTGAISSASLTGTSSSLELSVKRLMNRSEAKVNERLKKICVEKNAHVFPKVRLADVLEIEGSGIADRPFSYALKSHFDFVVTDDEMDPLFAVEFDGPYHDDPEQQERDALKDELCRRLHCPLVRIEQSHLAAMDNTRRLDALSWLAEIWFSKQEFEEARERGEIPYDEPFMARAIIRADGYEPDFPFWVSRRAQSHVRKLWHKRQCPDMLISTLSMRGYKGGVHGLGFVRLTPETAVSSTASMRQVGFHLVVDELVREIAVLGTFDRLRAVRRGDAKPESFDTVQQRVLAFRAEHDHLLSGSTTGTWVY